LKSGHFNRSSLLTMQAHKNIIKPYFLKATSCRHSHDEEGQNWQPRFQRGVYKLIRSPELLDAPPQALACQLAPRVISVASTANCRLVVSSLLVYQALRSAFFASIGKNHYRRD